MTAYGDRVKKDIARWMADGLIDAATAEKLVHDIDRHLRARISFPAIFAMMAAVLLGGALLLFIAANWEAMPRLVRVGMLFMLIVAGYLGGAVLKERGATAFGEAAWIVAAIGFGGSIALIGQMYHLSGDERDAILTWFAGTALAAALLRSPSLTVGAVLLSGAWMLMGEPMVFDFGQLPFGWLAFAILLWLISFWTASAASRHLLSLGLILFIWMAYLVDETLLMPTLQLALAAGLLAWDRTFPDTVARIGLGAGVPVHGLIHFLSAVALLHVLLVDGEMLAIAVILTLAGIAAILLASGRRSRVLRWLAYGAFAIELCYVYMVLLGTMLGTAGFLLMAGLGLAALAWAIRRLEGRFTKEIAA